MKSPSIECIIRRGGSWPKLWDSALHLGSRHTIGLKNLSKLLVHHGRGLHPCPLCDEQVLSIPIIDHVISAHKGETGLNFDSVDRLLSLLVDGDIILVSYFHFSFQLVGRGKGIPQSQSSLYSPTGSTMHKRYIRG